MQREESAGCFSSIRLPAISIGIDPSLADNMSVETDAERTQEGSRIGSTGIGRNPACRLMIWCEMHMNPDTQHDESISIGDARIQNVRALRAMNVHCYI